MFIIGWVGRQSCGNRESRLRRRKPQPCGLVGAVDPWVWNDRVDCRVHLFDKVMGRQSCGNRELRVRQTTMVWTRGYSGLVGTERSCGL